MPEPRPNASNREGVPNWLPSRHPFHIMTKPIGPVCNLGCEYCFYCEKKNLFPDNESFRMSDAVLEHFIRTYIESQQTPEVNFAWQGGEPTLMGLNFFRRVVKLERKYANGKRISNSLQTNGILLDDDWCRFFAQQQFLIGISIDGPPELHDRYRRTRSGKGTSDQVLRAIECMTKHGVQFNSLTSVARANSQHPLDLYNYFKSLGVVFMQFIPIIERLPDAEAEKLGLDLAVPPKPRDRERHPVTDWSVRPKEFGRFLIKIFDEWVRKDVGRIFVQQFDGALANWAGQPGAVCVFSETCGNAMILEHNGDLYACDHYMYPEYRLGNIMTDDLSEMAYSPKQAAFGNDKRDGLPDYCRTCDVLFACHGECPKHRFLSTPDGDPGLNYLCEAYKDFFHHINPYMQQMVQLLRMHRAPAEIMKML